MIPARNIEEQRILLSDSKTSHMEKSGSTSCQLPLIIKSILKTTKIKIDSFQSISPGFPWFS